MNGEFSELLTEIKRWSNEVHSQRHKENLAKFDRIYDELKELAKLPVQIKFIVIAVGFLYTGLATILFLWIKSAIAS